MDKNKLADGVLVYDRYYGNKPLTVLLAAERLLLCCFLALSAMMYVLTEYELAVDIPVMAILTGVSAAVFFLLFCFAKKRYAIPVLLLIAGGIVYYNYELLWNSIKYYLDAMMLLAEGRFIFPRQFLFHDVALLHSTNSLYTDGVSLGIGTMCTIFAFVCALSLVKKVNAAFPVALLLIYCFPMMLSEKLEFNVWLIPLVAMVSATIVISLNYRSGLEPAGKVDYKASSKREERSFLRTSRRSGYMKRLSMHASFYSKYYSVGMAGAAIFTAAVIAASVIYPQGTAISYAEVVSAITSMGDDFGVVSSPFEEGPVSEYFTGSDESSGSELNIISPGNGEKDIIKVSFTGDQPIYLRGDIGVDFTGKSWSSLVTATPEGWHGMLAERYRPCELKMTRALLSASDTESFADSVVSSEDLRIEYLCETDVVFLPPYTGEFSYYDNNSFSIHGDLVLRVNRNSGSYVNAVECTALVPSYTNTEVTGDISKIEDIENAYSKQSMISPDEIAATVLTDVSGSDGLITAYSEYVNNTYLDIDDSVKTRIAPFIEEMQLSKLSSYTSTEKYMIADVIADYLRTNYTYTTENVNGGSDPVMNFLYVTKRGHCSLYASAMTLMLRYMGIPARYCTGFYVVSDNRYGDTTVLKEKNLHAWVEVYLDEIGWVTFDPTSSSAFPTEAGEERDPDASNTSRPDMPNSRPEQPSVPNRPESSIPERDDPVSSQPTVEPTVPTDEFDISAYMPFIIAIGIVVLIGGIVAAILLWYRSMKYGAINALGRMRNSDPTEGARAAYSCILKLVELYGFNAAGGEMPVDFYQRIDTAFGTDLSILSNDIVALEFGDEVADEQLRTLIVNELLKIYGKMLKRFKLFSNRISVMSIVKKSM